MTEVSWARELLDRIEDEESNGPVFQIEHLSPELQEEIRKRKFLETFCKRGLEDLKNYLRSIA